MLQMNCYGPLEVFFCESAISQLNSFDAFKFSVTLEMLLKWTHEVEYFKKFTKIRAQKIEIDNKIFSTQLKATLKYFTSLDDILSKTRIIEHVNSMI